jgi:hypothetical protein
MREREKDLSFHSPFLFVLLLFSISFFSNFIRKVKDKRLNCPAGKKSGEENHRPGPEPAVWFGPRAYLAPSRESRHSSLMMERDLRLGLTTTKAFWPVRHHYQPIVSAGDDGP